MLLQDFLISASRYPLKPAIISASGSHNYDELQVNLFSVAAWLEPRIGPGDRVALVLDNSADYVACCYAIWAAGGVVVGLNTALKDEDLVALLQHCGARQVVLADKAKRLRLMLSGMDIGVLVAGTNHDGLAPAEQLLTALDPPTSTEIPRQQEATDAAAIIYTSGTTGDPKGVVLSHENLARNVAAIQDYLAIRSDDRVMCVLPFYYSYGNSVLHTHVTRGATLVLENSLMYPHRLLDQMQRWEVSSFYGVPSTYYLLLARTQLESFDLSRLRYCAQAGGPMNEAKIAKWLEFLPDTRFIVMYGQTEASARLSWLPPGRMKDKPGSVGIAIPGVELGIKDEMGRALPPGTQGEVCARGDSIMQGYWRNERATAEVLRDGWLHTGDLGYQDEEGFLFLVGRNREMIKTGAHRVSPREIEEVIAGIEGVTEVAVIGIEDDIMGQVVKACVIAGPAGDGLRKQIHRRCRQRLALYKVPKEIAFYEDFPRTASGKIKKHLIE